MSGMFALVSGSAEALGPDTATTGTTETFAGGGMAIGVAAFVAVAVGSDGALPQTTATTIGVVSGGSTTSSHTDTVSIDFPYGPTPVSATFSLTFVSAHAFEPLHVDMPLHNAFSGVGGSALLGIA